MIPEDRRRALARTRVAREGRSVAEQALVLLGGAGALLLLLLV